MYVQKVVVLLNKPIALFFVLVNRPKNAPLFTLLNQLGPVYEEVGDPR